MSIQKTYSRSEISKILKIAAELEQSSKESVDGLTESELEKIAAEAGLDPALISKAIFQLEQGTSPVDHSMVLTENNKFKTAMLVDGVIDDVTWEEVVAEIRSTHGGIGKVNMLGSSYEWEQRKQNVGYIQVTATPKKGHTKVSINSNYTYYNRMIGLAMGFGGFVLGAIIGDTMGLDDASILSAFLGASLGFTASRYYFKRWMNKKTAILKHMTNRISKVIQESTLHTHESVSEIELPSDEYVSDNDTEKSPSKVKED